MNACNKKLTINLNLKQKKLENTWTQVYLTMTINGTRIRVYSGQKVPPCYWDDYLKVCVTRGISNKRVARELREVNEKLRKMMGALRVLDSELAMKGRYLSHDAVRVVVKKYCASAMSFYDPISYMSALVDVYDEGMNRRGARGVESSKVAYRTALERLERFRVSSGRSLSSFDEFDKGFFKDFSDFLYSYSYVRGGKVLKYTMNTVVNTLKVVKNFLHKAYDDQVSNNDYFMRVQTVLPAKVAEKVYLSEDELERFARAQVENRRERELRDMFVLAAYSGLRISDIRALNGAAIADGKISLVQKKTKGKVVIPILKEVKGLVEYYSVVGFPKLDYSWSNRMLKVIAQRAGLDEAVVFKECRGGGTRVCSMKKYELVTFHTARRSCITNLYKRGYSVNHLMSLSGHHSSISLERYIKASDGEMGLELWEQLASAGDI